ncbi:MAG: hypothetical protein GXP28_04385 [Planctomycetes bacterium]|nr:hypothetical protein [Planctomycetota bacterium]
MLDPNHPIADLLRRDKRYHFNAYVFVFEALRHAQESLGMGTDYFAETDSAKTGASENEEEPERHVSGQELCEAMRVFAHEEYGYLAKCVLNEWGIKSTGDFGEIVFNLIEIEQMRKTPHDRREDFEDVYDFDEGFREGFEFSMPDTSGEHRS